MKTIEIDDDLYHYIASNTRHIGESASSILRRLLQVPESVSVHNASATAAPATVTKSPTRRVTAANFEKVLSEIDNSQQKAAVRRFLSLLTVLYHQHPESFSQVLDIRGRNRLYFALQQEELQRSGRSINPMAIPDTPYWVIGNTNTERKREILSQVMLKLGYNENQIARATKLL